jgi:hypothetical protein
VDKEKLIAIDNGALRFQPLMNPGWGKQGIAYGPYHRSNGLAFAVFLLNGHNTSQLGHIEDDFKQRLSRWIKGSETEKPLQRLLRWACSNQKKGIVKRILYWAKNTPKRFQSPCIDENLAIGWFPNEVPANPLAEGNAFIIHATGPENGELWARVGTNLLSAFKGLQNIQVYYIVILREKGAAYYAASVPNAYGLVAYPNMRPLAIDPFNDDATVYAGLYQSVLGQIGFRVDTRVYGVQVEQIPEIATWYGTAHVADNLQGQGLLKDVAAEMGGYWTVYQGCYELTVSGVRPSEVDSLAVLDPRTPSGLIHGIIETSVNVTDVSIIWRFQDKNNFWSFLLDGEKCQLKIKENGFWISVAVSQEWHLHPKTIHSVQILDDGETFSLYLNGKLVFNNWFTDLRLQNGTGVGMSNTSSNHNLYLRAFEAHPRSVYLPRELDVGSPWILEGQQIVVQDNFEGIASDLAGKTTNIGSQIWRKDLGTGVIELMGNGTARVRANSKQPNPDRTAYNVPWNNSNFADVQLNIVPPGTERGQKEKGRAGIIFWQDANNYITVSTWLDDWYSGSSISSFFYLKGFEELYDAVWTNVGSRIYWGIPYILRVVFDGMNYTAFVNDEPVLYRALTDVYPDIMPLAINRVGIVANWEWGNDTGSVFSNFVAKE